MTKIDKTHEAGFPGIWIPTEVFLHPSLTLLEKSLFGILKNLSSTSKGCWASNRYLSHLFSVTPQTISKAIASLVEFNFITAEYSMVTSNKSGTKQVRIIRIDENYPSLYKGLKNNILESFETDISTLKDNLKCYEKPLDPLKKNLNSPLRKILNKDTIEKNKKENKKNKQKNSSSKTKKKIPENLRPISFRETLNLFPPELEYLKDDPEFMKWWKIWYRYRKMQTPKSCRKPEPLTAGDTDWQLRKFKNCSVKSIIDGLDYAKSKSNKGAFPQKDGTPTPKKKPKKPKSEMTPAEQFLTEEVEESTEQVIEYLSRYCEPDEDRIYSGLYPGGVHMQKLYEQQEAYEKEAIKILQESDGTDTYQHERARIWRDNLPLLTFIVERYIQDLTRWVKEPNEAFFDWNHKTFAKFREKLKRDYYEYDWDKAQRISS